MKKKQSFRSPDHISKKMTKKIEYFIEFALSKLENTKQEDKNYVIYCLAMIMFSKFLALSHPLFGKIIQTLINLTKSKIV